MKFQALQVESTELRTERPSVPFMLGFQDGQDDEGSEYDGYTLFAGSSLDEYLRGFAEGRLAEPQMPEELAAELQALVLAEVAKMRVVAARKCAYCAGTGKHRACSGAGCRNCWNTGVCTECLGAGWVNQL